MRRFSPLGFAIALSACSPLAAQDKAAVPTLTTPAHLGATRGQRVDLTLAGTNLAGVTEVRFSFPANVAIADEKRNANKLAVSLDIPADTTIGPHTVRVLTKAGNSLPRPFAVDELPEVKEDDRNNSRITPQVISVPCVIVGTASTEAGDFFKLPVKAGKPLTLDVLGRRLGSPMDPVLIVSDGAGREIAGVYADDTPGLQGDARLTYMPKADGNIVVEVRDTTYRGGTDYGYRLRVGDFPSATTAFPLAVERDKTATAGFTGPDVVGVKPVTVTAPTDPAITVVYAAPRRADGAAGWPVPVRVSDFPELVEKEPNNDPATANRLAMPGGISARFAEKNDLDYFSFPGKKGQKLLVRVQKAEINSPAEVGVRVLDSKGNELAKSDPLQPGTRAEFSPPADGDYLAVCRHQNYLAGPNEVYHLSVTAAPKEEKKEPKKKE